MDENIINAIKEYKRQGFGLTEPGHLDAVIDELKRTEKLLRALGGYDLALYRLYTMDLSSFEDMKKHRNRKLLK